MRTRKKEQGIRGGTGEGGREVLTEIAIRGTDTWLGLEKLIQRG